MFIRLQNFQKSHQAWEISIDILQNNNSSMEELVFASQTIHRKFQKQHELIDGYYSFNIYKYN